MLVPKAQCSTGAGPLHLPPTPNTGACCTHPMPAPPSSAHPSPSSKLGLVGTLLLSESRHSHDQARPLAGSGRQDFLQPCTSSRDGAAAGSLWLWAEPPVQISPSRQLGGRWRTVQGALSLESAYQNEYSFLEWCVSSSLKWDNMLMWRPHGSSDINNIDGQMLQKQACSKSNFCYLY